jgi:hypothetical protein
MTGTCDFYANVKQNESDACTTVHMQCKRTKAMQHEGCSDTQSVSKNARMSLCVRFGGAASQTLERRATSEVRRWRAALAAALF